MKNDHQQEKYEEFLFVKLTWFPYFFTSSRLFLF